MNVEITGDLFTLSLTLLILNVKWVPVMSKFVKGVPL